MSRRPGNWGTLLLLTALVAPRAARAQSPTALAATSPASAAGALSCLDRVADSTLVPKMLYLHASELNDLNAASRAHVFDVDVFSQAVAKRFMALLHAAPGVVPAGEPTFTWRTRETDVRVIVDPAGQFIVRPADDTTNAEVRGALPRSRLLTAAVDSLRAEGQRFVFTGLPPDSLAFDLNLSPVSLSPDGRPGPLRWRAGFAVATLRMPPQTSVSVRAQAKPRYPEPQRLASAEAKVYVEFVVDTTGRADLTTMHAFWPKYLPQPAGAQKASYDEFLDAAFASIRSAKYDPASVGGCVVRQLVRQPFTFSLAP